jgi:hypothetical protein
MSTHRATKGADIFITTILLCQAILLILIMTIKSNPSVNILMLIAIGVIPQHILSIPSRTKYSSTCFAMSLVVLSIGMLFIAGVIERWLGGPFAGWVLATLVGYALLFIIIALLKTK